MTNIPYWIMRIQESLGKEFLVTHNSKLKLINLEEKVAQHWLAPPAEAGIDRTIRILSSSWIIIKGLKLEIRELPAFTWYLYKPTSLRVNNKTLEIRRWRQSWHGATVGTRLGGGPISFCSFKASSKKTVEMTEVPQARAILKTQRRNSGR